MSVDFEFRNKKNPLSYEGTPSYSAVKKLFKSGTINGTKIDKIETNAKGKESFSVNCGGGCYIYVYDVSGTASVVMPHFDHMERADKVLQQVAKHFDCIVLNDLEGSPYWSQEDYKKSKKSVEKSKFGISTTSIRNVFGLDRAAQHSTNPKRKVCKCKK